MTDEAKRMASVVRQYAKDDPIWAKCGEGRVHPLVYAAEMIEKLSVDLESDERQYGRDAFETLVAEGVKLEADRDAWKRRAEAAERDINKISELYPCAVCKHWYLGGCVLAANLDDPHWRCNRENNRFEWRGPCEENMASANKKAAETNCG